MAIDLGCYALFFWGGVDFFVEKCYTERVNMLLKDRGENGLCKGVAYE